MDECVHFIDGNVCVDSCPEQRAFHDASGRCVATCPGAADSEGLCQEADLPSEDRKSHSGLVAAIVVPAVLVLAAAVIAAVLVCRKRK